MMEEVRKRGRPKGEDTRVMHVRVPVRLLDQLETLQFVTKRPTSDLVRNYLETYVLQHEDLLTAVARARGELERTYTAADIDAQERGQIEADEELGRELAKDGGHGDED